MAACKTTFKILGVCGSLRAGSFNRVALLAALEGAKAAGAEVDFYDFHANPLQFYDQDLEKDGKFPDDFNHFRNKVRWADAVIFSTPEYNGSISSVLKNAIDVGSRSVGEDRAVWGHKPVGCVGCSMGRFGTLRASDHMRTILNVVGADLVAPPVMIASAHTVIKEGKVQDEGTEKRLHGLGKGIVDELRDRKCGVVARELMLKVNGLEFSSAEAQVTN